MKFKTGIRKVANVFFFLSGVSLCFGVFSFGMQAQVVGLADKLDKSPEKRKRVTRSAPRKTPTSRRSSPTKSVSRETTKGRTGVIVDTLPYADIILESDSPRNKVHIEGKTDINGEYTNDKLKPGSYFLSTALDGFKSDETEIRVVSQEMLRLAITLERNTFSFTIETNVSSGEVRYAPVAVQEVGNDDLLSVVETEGYCVVFIKDGKAVISDVFEGEYNLDVRTPDQPEYGVEKVVVKVPDDTEDLRIDLKNRQSTDTFNQVGSKEAWDLPSGWNVDSRGMMTELPGIALPSSDSYRFYKDFEMRASLRLVDNKSVGFVFRAEDENNYYVIRLTGAGSANPYRVSVYAVKDGTEELISDLSISHLAKILGDGKFFEIIIHGKGNTFEFSLRDSADASEYSLGRVEPRTALFPIGAVGISLFEVSKVHIGYFTVCDKSC